jgi:hypothetical protein
MSYEIGECDTATATIYQYQGTGTASSAVSRVKKHHAEQTDVAYQKLSARQVSQRGGRKDRTILVIVVSPITDSGGDE